MMCARCCGGRAKKREERLKLAIAAAERALSFMGKDAQLDVVRNAERWLLTAYEANRNSYFAEDDDTK
jgi:hypothetical protein